MRISDWSSDVCSSDLLARTTPGLSIRNGWGDSAKISIRGIASSVGTATTGIYIDDTPIQVRSLGAADIVANVYPEVFDLERIEVLRRSEEHTSELQSLMRISYAVFCLKKKKTTTHNRS